MIAEDGVVNVRGHVALVMVLGGERGRRLERNMHTQTALAHVPSRLPPLLQL